MENKEYRAGVRAGKKGKLRVSNPYNLDLVESERWDAGWVTGTQEARIEQLRPKKKAR